MGIFNRKKKTEFYTKLRYGEDIRSIYEESKKLKTEENVMWDRIFTSEEYAKITKSKEKRKELEKQYEEILGKTYGFNPTYPIWVHIKDHSKNSNKCKNSPFGHHTIVKNCRNKDKKDTCLFCDAEE